MARGFEVGHPGTHSRPRLDAAKQPEVITDLLEHLGGQHDVVTLLFEQRGTSRIVGRREASAAGGSPVDQVMKELLGRRFPTVMAADVVTAGRRQRPRPLPGCKRLLED